MVRISIEKEKVSLKDVEISNVDYPRKLLVDFGKANVRYEYKDANGERVATDEVKKIVLNCKNAVVARKMAEIGLDSDTLQTLEIHIQDDFAYTLDLIEKKVVSEIELIKSRVKLLWVQRVNGGSYSDIQLIADEYKLLKESK